MSNLWMDFKQRIQTRMLNPFSVRLVFHKENEIRLVKIPREISYTELIMFLENHMTTFKINKRIHKITYTDEEGDDVNFSSQVEWKDCLVQHVMLSRMKLKVTTKAKKKDEKIVNVSTLENENRSFKIILKEFVKYISHIDKMKNTSLLNNIESKKLLVIVLFVHNKDLKESREALVRFFEKYDEAVLTYYRMNGIHHERARLGEKIFSGMNYDSDCVLYCMDLKNQPDVEGLVTVYKELEMWF